jgi:hypothetical protein
MARLVHPCGEAAPTITRRPRLAAGEMRLRTPLRDMDPPPQPNAPRRRILDVDQPLTPARSATAKAPQRAPLRARIAGICDARARWISRVPKAKSSPSQSERSAL